MIQKGKAKEILGKSVTIRSSPRASGGGTNSIAPFETVDFVAIVPDMDHPNDATRQWLDLGNNEYANYMYPPNGARFEIVAHPTPESDPVPALPVLTVRVDVNVSGYKRVMVDQDIEPE